MIALLASASCVLRGGVNFIPATGTSPCRPACLVRMLLNWALLVQEMRRICMLMAKPSRSSLPCKYVKAGSNYAYSSCLPHTGPSTAMLCCWRLLGVGCTVSRWGHIQHPSAGLAYPTVDPVCHASVVCHPMCSTSSATFPCTSKLPCRGEGLSTSDVSLGCLTGLGDSAGRHPRSRGATTGLTLSARAQASSPIWAQ